MSVDDDARAVPDHQTMLAAMRLAARAPSVHNTQPWHWRFDGIRLHLYTDADRLLSSTDPLGRQLVMSCGAMLDHVRTAFAERGWHTDAIRVPQPRRPEHLATIGFRPWPHPPAGLRARARAIENRCTDRLPLGEPGDWPETLQSLRALAAPHNVDLDVLDESVRPRLAAASQRLGSLRGMDMLYETELDWWVGHSGMPEGIPPAALASDAEFSRVGVGRVFPAAPHSMRRAELVDRARLVVLSTSRDSVTQWLHAGEALSAVLLQCAVAGLATCALTHITELPAGRKLLAELIPHPSTAQVVIRIGTAPEDEDAIPRTPRRALADIFTSTAPH
jgi:nitroreductase